MKKLTLLFAFFILHSYASAQWWGDNDWDKTPLSDFGFYNQYISKYNYKNSKYSWDDKKFPWNYSDKSWTNIILPWGNVGIGTLRPSEKLHVTGNVLIDGMLFTTSIKADTLTVANLTVTNNILARKNILVDGNIGIGVALPSQKLDIAGNLKVSNSIFSDSIITQGLRTGSGTFTNLSVSNSFNVSGKTGLGVSEPVEKLEVAGNIKTTQKLMAAEIVADTASFAKGIKINGNLVSSGNITSNTIYTNSIKLSGAQSIAIDNNITIAGAAVMDQTLAIGTTAVPSGYNLAVKGKIIAEEIKVRHFDTWPDYVFASSYKLKSLYQVEAYIKQHQHLEGIVPAAQAEAEGVEVGDMQAKLLEKIEQLTLYMIELKKENDLLAQKVARLEKQ
jgi:hypothetical protein